MASLKPSRLVFEEHPRVPVCSRGVHRVGIRALLFWRRPSRCSPLVGLRSSKVHKAQSGAYCRQRVSSKHFKFTRCGCRPLGLKHRSAWAVACAPVTAAVLSRRFVCSALGLCAKHRAVLPNPSVKAIRYGWQRKPGVRRLRHLRTPGLHCQPPLSPYLER